MINDYEKEQYQKMKIEELRIIFANERNNIRDLKSRSDELEYSLKQEQEYLSNCKSQYELDCANNEIMAYEFELKKHIKAIENGKVKLQAIRDIANAKKPNPNPTHKKSKK